MAVCPWTNCCSSVKKAAAIKKVRPDRFIASSTTSKCTHRASIRLKRKAHIITRNVPIQEKALSRGRHCHIVFTRTTAAYNVLSVSCIVQYNVKSHEQNNLNLRNVANHAPEQNRWGLKTSELTTLNGALKSQRIGNNRISPVFFCRCYKIIFTINWVHQHIIIFLFLRLTK